MFHDLTAILHKSYDRCVEERDAKPAPDWELRERNAFCELLRRERKRSVLDLGAATGTDAEFFRATGLDAVCVDLSPEMVRRCREKGLEGHVMDLGNLRFPASSFDAVYAKNSLVHLPKAELPSALSRISRILRPGGLFYVALCGGYDFEGECEWDTYEPRRFFSFHTDAGLRLLLEQTFEVRSFRCLPHGWAGLHWQSVVLRSTSRAASDHGSGSRSG